MKKLSALVRPNILRMQPYSSARSEFKGQAEVFMDANENPFDNGLNRYPDPLQRELKKIIAQQKSLEEEQIFLGNGSDEAIDLLIRIFCEPREDHIITLPPTYGMYRVSASIADVAVKEIPLTKTFQPRVQSILEQSNAQSKLLFICSPNNPTGNSMDLSLIEQLAETFPGVIVVDEAYIDFAEQASCLSLLDRFPRLVIMQTFSKAWGMAGLRLGMAFAQKEIIDLFNKVKPPYNVNVLSQRTALKALAKKAEKDQFIQILLQERQRLRSALAQLDFVEKVYPSETNFFLIRLQEPRRLYDYLVGQKIIVRDRSKVLNCEGCLRVSIGTPRENDQLLAAIQAYQAH
ncbi:MAG: histidinol-phosphate transaminase [Bacteroidota bacterium]